jgi:hypothetical protein
MDEKSKNNFISSFQSKRWKPVETGQVQERQTIVEICTIKSVMLEIHPSICFVLFC